MQFKLISGFLIFIGSYLPLALILAVQDIPMEWWERPLCDFSNISNCLFNPFTHPIPSIVFVIITTFSVVISGISLRKIKFPFDIEVKSSKAIPNDIINYVFPYVVAFMGISYNTPEKLIGFTVFLLWMFAITYKSGQIILNPLLLMFGWKLYEARVKINNEERDIRILKKCKLLPGNYKAQTIQESYVARDL